VTLLSLPVQATALRSLLLGLGLALGVMLLQESLAAAGMRLPNPAPLFFVAVVYATYAGGWLAGSGATVAALVYTAFVLFAVSRAGAGTPDALLRLAVLLPSLGAVVALVQALRRRAERSLAHEREAQTQRQRRQLSEHARQIDETLAALDEVVWSTTADGSRVLSVSAPVERLYGHPAEQFLREPDLWQRLILPEDRPSVMEAFATVGEKGAVDLEYRILRADGAVRRVRDRAHLSRDAAGRPLRLDGVISDITAEREAQARLRRLTNLYAALSECNQAIVRIEEPGRLYREVCRIAVDFGTLRMAWIGRIEGKRLVPAASHGARTDYLDSAAVALGAAGDGRPSVEAALGGRHVVCNDLEHEAGTAAWRERALACGFRAAAAFPIREGGEVVGSLGLYAADPGFFDPELVRLLDEMAVDVSFALDRFAMQAERAEVMERLRAAEERWQFALEGADTGVWDWDPASDRVYYSPRWKEMLGYAEHEVGDGYGEWESRLHPDDRERSLTQVADHLAGKMPALRVEYRLRAKDGSYRWILSQGRVMRRGPDGRPQRLIGTHTDITTLKEHEAALTRSNERLHALFHNMEEGVVLHELVRDAHGHPSNYLIVAVNPRFEALTGLRAENVVGRTGDAAYGTPTPPYLETFGDVAVRGRPIHFETYFSPLDRYFSISVAPWGEGGFATIFTDVSDRKRAEAEILRLNAELEQRVAERTTELQTSIRDLESFSYTVSHDLRAPLRAINGFASLLAEAEGERLTADGRGLLDRVVSNTRRMSQLIDDILEYSRVGRTRLAPARTDLHRLVEEVIGELRPAYPAAEIVLNPLPPARVDAAMMRQVFANLVGNALKFSSKCSAPRIEIGTRAAGAATEYYVRDNGAGFDMHYADKLFGMFQRMHGAMEFPGTGVGLAIVKRLIERHGGSIRAEAAPGQGAAFYFTLGG
jgi:PAS domain S-box-containing protein